MHDQSAAHALAPGFPDATEPGLAPKRLISTPTEIVHGVRVGEDYYVFGKWDPRIILLLKDVVGIRE